MLTTSSTSTTSVEVKDDSLLAASMQYHYCEIKQSYGSITQTEFLEGLAKLAVVGTVEIAEVVEDIHCEIMLRPQGKFKQEHIDNWKGGLSGRAYAAIKQVAMLIGNNLTSVLRLYNHVEKSNLPTESLTVSEMLKLVTNVVNGIMGDHLVSQNNPLAIPMMFYNSEGESFDNAVQTATTPQDKLAGRVVILTHGLCMSYLSWRLGQDTGLGEHILRNQKDTTILYLDYNTGQHISTNGRKFASLLEDLVENHPDITQIDLIGHSMGGLVSRSALFYGEQHNHKWFELAGNLITLGSPHHGAVLERIGFYVLDVISKLPFAGTLAKIGDVRSAGIIDLRHGSIRDDDWNHLGVRTGLAHDVRNPTALPEHINTYLVAGSLETNMLINKANGLIGDTLVAVDSALGEHEGDYVLNVPEGHKAIFYGVGHMNLQYNDRVREQVLYWLSLGQNKVWAEKHGIEPPIYRVPSHRIESYPVAFDVAV